MKIYILSMSNEYGAENVKATTDLDKVPDIIDSFSELDDWLVSDMPLDLNDGWGGMQLHIVELEQ